MTNNEARKVKSKLRDVRKKMHRLEARRCRDLTRLEALSDQRNRLLDKLGYIPAGL